MRVSLPTMLASCGGKSATASWRPCPGAALCPEPGAIAVALQTVSGSPAAALDLAQEILAEIRACQADPFLAGAPLPEPAGGPERVASGGLARGENSLPGPNRPSGV